MANKGKLTLNGVDAHLERLAQLGRDVRTDAAEALQAGGEVAQEGMKKRVRKDTRNLEEHLVVNAPVIDGNFVSVEVGLIGADADTARYGNAQEFGTSSMPGQSYVRATLDNDRSKIRAAIRASLEGKG